MEIDFDTAKFEAGLTKEASIMKLKQRQFVVLACAEVERTAKTIMRDTAVNTEISYGAKNHHPSLPGNPPAPDTGTLLQSVTHSIEEEDGLTVGYVGSTLKDYPRYLEYGTSKMKPRPWLSLALMKCENWINSAVKGIFGR